MNVISMHLQLFNGVTLDNAYGFIHYSDVIMGAMASQITSLTIFNQPFIKAQIKENIKAPCRWPLCVEFTGCRWIPQQMASNAEKFPFDDVVMMMNLMMNMHELQVSRNTRRAHTSAAAYSEKKIWIQVVIQNSLQCLSIVII